MHLVRGDIQTAVTLDDIKALGVIEHDQDDAKLALLAASVTREYCVRLNVALLPETVTAAWDTWACGVPLRLPVGPLLEANAATLTVTRTDGTTTTGIAASDIKTLHGERPTVTVNVPAQGPLSVTYVAGLPTVPESVRAALAVQVMHEYDQANVETTSRRYAPAYASALNTRKRVSI